MNDNNSNNSQVKVAIIGLVGTLGVAMITAWVSLSKEPAAVKPSNTIIQAQKYSLKAIIDDPDGYTNVRSVGSANGQILDTIKVGEIFYTHIQEKTWWHVKTPRNKVGYMHSSRIRLLE